MLIFFSLVATGLFLGMRHATDPDHVVAVATIVSRERNLARAALTGVFWGVGHTVTIVVVGAAIILFGLVIPPRLGLSMELSVALMLLVLGLFNMASFLRAMPPPLFSVPGDSNSTHSHPHIHGDYVHNHPHGHNPEAHSHGPDQTPLAALDRRFDRLLFCRQLRPLVVGIVHGLAGSAAVALLILATIRNSYWALTYLIAFGVGTVTGMTLITLSIASAFHFVGRERKKFPRCLALASGLISFAFGCLLAYQICVVNGLFGSDPRWTPR